MLNRRYTNYFKETLLGLDILKHGDLRSLDRSVVPGTLSRRATWLATPVLWGKAVSWCNVMGRLAHSLLYEDNQWTSGKSQYRTAWKHKSIIKPLGAVVVIHLRHSRACPHAQRCIAVRGASDGRRGLQWFGAGGWNQLVAAVHGKEPQPYILKTACNGKVLMWCIDS